jgi:hypothetical protein
MELRLIKVVPINIGWLMTMLLPPEFSTDGRCDAEAFALLTDKTPANDNTPEDSEELFLEDLPAVTMLSVY